MNALMQYLNEYGIRNGEGSSSMIKSIILCNKCSIPLEPTGGESGIGEKGFTEHFYCESCDIGIDVKIHYPKDNTRTAVGSI